MKKLAKVKYCKHCKAPMYPDGQALRIVTPAMVRTMLAALHWGELSCEFYLLSRMRELGFVESRYKVPEPERLIERRKYMALLKRAASGTFEESQEIMKGLSWLKFEQKRDCLTPLGIAVAKWYRDNMKEPEA